MSNIELEVFRAGDYGAKGSWPEAALDQLAADYDPARHEAPVTLDHAQTGPAHGWVCGLRRAGDRLIATLRGLSQHVRELLTNGAYKKRSVELYPQFADTGRPYLRAVSLLGAAVPEVKGLSDPLVFEETVEPAPQGTPMNDANREPTGSSLSFAELATQLRASGRWQPAWEAHGIQAFFTALSHRQAAWFAEFLHGLAPVVALESVAPPPQLLFEAAWRGIEAAEGGPRVAPESLRLHAGALAMQQQHPELSYSEALLKAAR